MSAWTADHLPYREELEAAGALVAYSRQKGGWLSEEIAGLIQRIRQVAGA